MTLPDIYRQFQTMKELLEKKTEKVLHEFNQVKDEIRGEFKLLEKKTDKVLREFNQVKDEIRGEFNHVKDEIKGELNQVKDEANRLESTFTYTLAQHESMFNQNVDDRINEKVTEKVTQAEERIVQHFEKKAIALALEAWGGAFK